MWESLFEAGRLMRQIGVEITHDLGYTYPFQDDQRVTAYLEQVCQLPKDASSYH
jgi:aminoglycoside 6-adenylyltransferase